MINTSNKTLIILSAFVWVIGGIVLLLKGISLLKEAHIISPSLSIIVFVVLTALVVGLIKNKYIMSKFCRKNIDRIKKIPKPKTHQFFTPQFFIALTMMILTGSLLSSLAAGNYGFLLAVGALDLSLATALLTSSIVFVNFKK